MGRAERLRCQAVHRIIAHQRYRQIANLYRQRTSRHREYEPRVQVLVSVDDSGLILILKFGLRACTCVMADDYSNYSTLDIVHLLREPQRSHKNNDTREKPLCSRAVKSYQVDSNLIPQRQQACIASLAAMAYVVIMKQVTYPHIYYLAPIKEVMTVINY